MQESQMSLQNDDNNNNNNDDDFDPAVTHDDFLDQMLSGLHTTVTWPDINGQTKPWDVGHFDDDHSAFLSSKLRQHQITTTPAAVRTPAKPLQLTRGLTSPPIGDNNAIQNLFHGFTAGSLSSPNQTQQFPGQNFGSPGAAAFIQTASATVASGGGGGGGTPSQPRQRVRARRGQATDPHSIAERLRRERIAERMKALQELVPNANKTDKASMLDEIIDYVRFLQLQVKVLSMSRLGGAASNVTNPVVAEGGARSSNGTTSSTNNETTTVTENQVVKLMEEDMGSAMQYLQGKGLCLMPISLATAISNATCHPTGSRNNLPLGGEAGGPSSPNISVLTVQSANGVLVKDSP